MGTTIRDEVLSLFCAGETVKFRRSFPDFPAVEGWKYSFHMNGAMATLHREAVQDEAIFVVTITPADGRRCVEQSYCSTQRRPKFV